MIRKVVAGGWRLTGEQMSGEEEVLIKGKAGELCMVETGGGE